MARTRRREQAEPELEKEVEQLEDELEAKSETIRRLRNQLEEEPMPVAEEMEVPEDHAHPDYEEVMRSFARRLGRTEGLLRRREQDNDPLPPVEDTLGLEPKAAESEADARSKALERALRKEKRRREQAEDELAEEQLEGEDEVAAKAERVRRLRNQLEDEEKKLEDLETPVVAPAIAAPVEPDQLKESLSKRKTTVGRGRVKESLGGALKNFYRATGGQ